MQGLLDEYRRHRCPFAVAVFDIDHFKLFNDTHGHLAGDTVLQQFTLILQEGCRDSDVVARYGSEEFIVVLIGTALAPAMHVARRIVAVTRLHSFHFKGQNVHITVSSGVVDATEVPGDMLSADEALIDKSDQRLYRAKNEGRDRVVAWDCIE
ncbi:MAG: GGDEF domain-containing protein [Candidatus Brocadiaceae baterium WH-1]|nr:MAG: GGDEF domain-containing protein [Candidatus Jettenia sp. AMX2]